MYCIQTLTKESLSQEYFVCFDAYISFNVLCKTDGMVYDFKSLKAEGNVNGTLNFNYLLCKIFHTHEEYVN